MSVFRVGSNKSSVNNFPTVRPTLDLDFANSKTLDPRITFTRASGGSYVGADGLIKYAGVNEARFDHDPATGESLGLLIEEQRVNLLNDSQNFLSSSWSSGTGAITRSTISPSTIISPEGTTNTFKLTEDTSMGTHVIGKGVTTFTLGTIFINSVFVKSAERTRVTVGAAADSKGRIFDLVNGTTFGTGSGVPGWGGLPDSDCGIIPYENGWFRIWTKHTSTNNPGNALYDRFNLFLTKDSIASYEGDGTSGVYIWGAQLEAGSFPTSYIPTQGSTRTRAADTVELSGNNFSSWFNRNEGSIRMQYKPLFNGRYKTPFRPLFVITDGVNSSKAMGFVGNDNESQLYFVGSSGAPSTTILPYFTWLAPPTPSSQRKETLSFSYTADFIRAYTNRVTFLSTSPTYGSGKPISDLSKTQVKPTSVNYIKLSFGGQVQDNGRFNCHIQNFRYYPKELGVELVKNLSDRNR